MSKGRYIACQKGVVLSNQEQLERLIKEKPGAVLTALAQLPYSDRKSLKWVTRKALASLSASC